MTFFCWFRDLSITALNKSLFGDISFISVSKCRYDSDLLFASNFFNDGVLGKTSMLVTLGWRDQVLPHQQSIA